MSDAPTAEFDWRAADAQDEAECVRILNEMQERYRREFEAAAAPYIRILTDIRARNPMPMIIREAEFVKAIQDIPVGLPRENKGLGE